MICFTASRAHLEKMPRNPGDPPLLAGAPKGSGGGGGGLASSQPSVGSQPLDYLGALMPTAPASNISTSSSSSSSNSQFLLARYVMIVHPVMVRVKDKDKDQFYCVA